MYVSLVRLSKIFEVLREAQYFYVIPPKKSEKCVCVCVRRILGNCHFNGYLHEILCMYAIQCVELKNFGRKF